VLERSLLDALAQASDGFVAQVESKYLSTTGRFV
jgi:hypothetical protein